jgi:pimeloyl-ACP methyl ester carboxylesterase
MTSQLAQIDWCGQPVSIEYEWVGTQPADGNSVPLIFLHEGLGSVSMWRNFPQRLCSAVGMRGLVYSRPGYGRSTPRSANEHWEVDFMHRQAYEVLPAFLATLGINEPPWLLGHSDGGSIALLYAARYPTAGAIVMAPHIFVEDICISCITQAHIAYKNSDLRAKLARYHEDPDSAFGGWSGIWLNPAFRAWNIEDEISSITCPVLAIQGIDDPYGTLEQIHGIARCVPGSQLVEIPACGHSPHRDQPKIVLENATRFIHEHRSASVQQIAVESVQKNAQETEIAL